MRNKPPRGLTRDQGVIGGSLALEDARKLMGEGMPLDTIQVKNGDMRRKT